MLQRRPFRQPAMPERKPLAWPGKQEFVPATRCDGAGVAQAKTVEHRNPTLLAMARGKPCLFRLPGICNYDPATTVACHENQGKGMGIKASDARSAQGCSACHEAYDRGPAMRDVKREWFYAAFRRQLLEWQRVVGDLSELPRSRRAAHWALCLLEASPALDLQAHLAIESVASA